MNNWQKITVGAGAVLAYGVSSYVAYAVPPLAVNMATIQTLALTALSGLVGYHVRNAPAPTETKEPTP